MKEEMRRREEGESVAEKRKKCKDEKEITGEEKEGKKGDVVDELRSNS